MSKPNRLPWKAQFTTMARGGTGDKKIFKILADNGSGRVVASGPAWTEQEEANARFIVTAANNHTKMLALLRNLSSRARGCLSLNETLLSAEALIAKIEEEKS